MAPESLADVDGAPGRRAGNLLGYNVVPLW